MRATDLFNRRSLRRRGRALRSARGRVSGGAATVSPALYNAGLCSRSREKEQAAARYERLLREESTSSSDVKARDVPARELTLELERWDETPARRRSALARRTCSPEERMEAMARRSQACSGGAARRGRAAGAHGGPLVPDAPGRARVHDEFFAAASSFVLAETIREARRFDPAFPRPASTLSARARAPRAADAPRAERVLQHDGVHQPTMGRGRGLSHRRDVRQVL